MNDQKYEIIWVIKYLFPIAFIGLFTVNLFRFSWSQIAIHNIDFHETFITVIELFLLYIAIYCLTVSYEIRDDKLIVHSFFFRIKEYNIKSVQWMDEEGIYSFLGQINIGVDVTVLNFAGGKRLIIIGLNSPLKFRQEIRSIQAGETI